MDIKLAPSTRPEFMRAPSWTTPAARDLWAPRIQAIMKAWSDVERASVQSGARYAALTFVEAGSLPRFVAEMKTLRLMVTVLAHEASSNGLYRATSVAAPVLASGAYRVLLSRAEEVSRFGYDDFEIGMMLGYPVCCREAFKARWGAGWRDFTWPTFVDSNQDASGPVDVNLLLRWLGVRLVPHLPCRFDCQRSQEFADKLAAFWPQRELAWARELLGMQMTWDARHGIAMVTTPLFRFTTSTDVVADGQRLVVSRRGTVPELAPTGLSTTTRPGPAVTVTSGKGYREALQAAGTTAHQSNGFTSHAAMVEAHDKLLATLRPDLATLAHGDTIVDLGCGDGTLLAKIHSIRPDLVVWGVESDPVRAALARERLRPIGGHVVEGKIHETLADWPTAQLALIMPGRILEQPIITRPETVTRLTRQAQRLCCYSYDDPKSAAKLAFQAGLTWKLIEHDGPITIYR